MHPRLRISTLDQLTAVNSDGVRDRKGRVMGEAEREVFTPKYISVLGGTKETTTKSGDTKGHFHPLRKSSVLGRNVFPPKFTYCSPNP